MQSVVHTGLEWRVRERVLKQSPAQVGKWLSRRLPTMGPTYTKLGQFVSSRPDVFGLDLCRQLYTLHDNVMPMEFDGEVYDRLRRLGLRRVNRAPMAAASIAQVHRGTLEDGTDVVVKIRRPGVADAMRRDMGVLKLVLRGMALARVDGVSETAALLEAFEERILGETDLLAEARALAEFRAAYRDIPFMVVPRVYPELSSEEFLVMDYVPSVKLTDIEDGHRKQVAVLLMTGFMHQLLAGGFVHADPHGGNMGLHVETKQLVLYDFGNVVRLPEDVRRALKAVVLYMIEGDVDAIVEALPSIGITVHEPGALRTYIASYIQYLRSLDVQQLLAAPSTLHAGAPVQRVPMSSSMDMLCLLRIFSMLEGLCKSLDADFSYESVWPVVLANVLADADLLGGRMWRALAALTASR
jgi:predicted unusual protein kinase regulating ubiquinone biosynthesis (AarF/ABC1/UbiB family)